MKAGFAIADVTPPLGMFLGGWAPVTKRPSQVVHSPIELRALAMEQDGRRVVIISFDWCFVERVESDRFKGVLNRVFGLNAHEVMLASTHTHAGPAVGSFTELRDLPPPWDYIKRVEKALIDVVGRALSSLEDVQIRAGSGTSTIPMNRRRLRDGKIDNAPNPPGVTNPLLPVCVLQGKSRPVCVLFSISSHPVSVTGAVVSSDYPGITRTKLDEHFGAPCALFLQGTGGDSRPRQLSLGEGWNWKATAAHAEEIGQTLFAETLKVIETGLSTHEPALASALIETQWPLEKLTAGQAAEIAASSTHQQDPTMRPWAKRIGTLQARGELGFDAPVLMQGIRLSPTLRLLSTEGEPVAEHGLAMARLAPSGVTFPLGYANGEGMYLVTSEMIPQGGYEVESYWEFGYPTPLAPGMESVLRKGVQKILEQMDANHARA